MKTVVYGVCNCNTMRKSFAWLKAQGIDYDFHDLKKHGIEREKLADWCRRLGWEALLNTRGPSFRRLPEAMRQGLDAERAFTLMLEHPNVIRRPVIEQGRALLAGFDEDAFARQLR